MSCNNFTYQDYNTYYKRIIAEYAHRTQLKFVSRVRAKKPYLTLTQDSLVGHVKDIMLGYVLPRLNSYSIEVWPPPNIHQLIDQAVNEYIANLVPVV